MIRACVLVILAGASANAASLTLSPSFLYDCTQGLATAKLNWTGATGPVQIHVVQPDGPPLTDFSDPAGTAVTGNWVSDGMVFYLVNHAGTVEASAVAHVNCAGTVRTIDQGLAAGSYFPLAVGNTWVYKTNDRSVTASYVVRTITGTQDVGGQTYYVVTQTAPTLATLMLLRSGDNGMILQWTGNGDQVYLDPNAPGVSRIRYSGPLGLFTDAVQPPTQLLGSIIQTTSVFVRGIGFASSQSNMLSGSSGGFTSSFDLVDVRVDGVHLSVPAPKIGLSIENADLNLTGQLAPNCALPCYFAACFGADPPATYRPCAQARVESNAPAGYTVTLQLLRPDGTSVFQDSTDIASTDSLRYVRLPLYTAVQSSFSLLRPGAYKLVASIAQAGAEVATSSLTLHIR